MGEIDEGVEIRYCADFSSAHAHVGGVVSITATGAKRASDAAVDEHIEILMTMWRGRASPAARSLVFGGPLAVNAAQRRRIFDGLQPAFKSYEEAGMKTAMLSASATARLSFNGFGALMKLLGKKMHFGAFRMNELDRALDWLGIDEQAERQLVAETSRTMMAQVGFSASQVADIGLRSTTTTHVNT